MGEYPVHNYGTNPLGQFGLRLLERNLDWAEKQKILERQAQTEVLKSNREMLGKQAETGTLASGFETTAGQLGIAPNVVQGMGQQAQQAKFQTYLKELGQTADLSKKKQDYLSAEIDKYTKMAKYWSEGKVTARESGQDVIKFNDNLSIIDDKLKELTGISPNLVGMTEISDLKKYKEQVAIGEVSKLESQLTQAMAGNDPKAVAAASSALSSQIMTSAKQLGMPKDTFASANDTLKQANESLKTMLSERVKGPAKGERTLDNYTELVLSKYYPGFATDPVIRETAYKALANPQFFAKVTAEAGEIAKGRVPSANVYIGQTPEGGVVVGNTRGAPQVQTVGGPGAAILPKNAPPLPSEQTTALQQIQTLRDAVKTVDTNYDPSFVGPLAGRVSSAREKVVGGYGMTEKQATFNSALEQSRNSLVYLLSGKQINEMEFERLSKQLPDRNLAPTVFRARMKEFNRTLDSILTNKEKQLKASGYQVAPMGGGIKKPLSSY